VSDHDDGAVRRPGMWRDDALMGWEAYCDGVVAAR
jgi:hypothetical protein